MLNKPNTNDRILAALQSIYRDRYHSIQEGSVFFCYEIDDNDPKDQWSIYRDISEKLQKKNLRIADPRIEHDCISGNVVFIEDE